ncbi:MAG: 3-deoxy-8-phosphooctulonate synthase [Bacteroidales bacterium]|nr:3-deoxy-8-phosphooctulonate synthase [Bacteroidales bacterium]
MKALELPLLKSYDQDNFFILAGPCVVESKDICRQIASTVAEIADKYAIPYVFKASYRKANRSRVDSFTGIGDQAGLEILQGIKEEFHLPIITDIHNPEEAALAASYGVDILQIPAFLCRQTELLEAAAKTGKYVNIKKGQFLAPDSMKFAAQKVEHFGNSNIILTDRGTQFGYSDLIIDFRGIPTMKSFGYPVVVDITHSLQEPNQSSGVTGGRPDMISTIAKASIAVGADGLFLETHPDPSQAKSDGANMLRLDLLENLIKTLLPIRQAIL